MSLHYKFRYTPQVYTPKVEVIDAILSHYSDRLCRVREGSPEHDVQIHYHYYVVFKVKKYESCRKQMREDIKDSMYKWMEENGDEEQPQYSRTFSFSQMKDYTGLYCVEYMRYMSKENEVIALKNVPEEWITKGKEDAIAWAKAYSENKKEKKAGGQYLQLVAYLDKKLKESKINLEITGGSTVITLITDWYVDRGTRFSTSMIEGAFTSYMCARARGYRMIMESNIYRKLMFEKI